MMIRMLVLAVAMVSSPVLAGKAVEFELGDLSNGQALSLIHI